MGKNELCVFLYNSTIGSTIFRTCGCTFSRQYNCMYGPVGMWNGGKELMGGQELAILGKQEVWSELKRNTDRLHINRTSKCWRLLE